MHRRRVASAGARGAYTTGQRVLGAGTFVRAFYPQLEQQEARGRAKREGRWRPVE